MSVGFLGTFDDHCVVVNYWATRFTNLLCHTYFCVWFVESVSIATRLEMRKVVCSVMLIKQVSLGCGKLENYL